MNHTCIDVDVWCKWDTTPPIYRVYVDDQMLTERTFTWETSRHYIREHIEVLLDEGWHELRIEDCSAGRAQFITNNIAVNGSGAGLKFIV